jgi:hypothetical protein
LTSVILGVLPVDAGVHRGRPGLLIFLQFGDVVISDVIYVDTRASEPFLEEMADVRRYELVFVYLRAGAASLEASLPVVTSSIAER